MANYLVAVSGGVDSAVLLDILHHTDHHLVVAHVDHGIRGVDSAADARFVEGLAHSYQVPFVSISLHLGTHASEEEARNRRYAFLFAEAKRYDATVVTAHHLDDVVETIALNLHRGTGWRGLAVLHRPGIVRPLLGLPKSTLYKYALAHRLEWVEDATNATNTYLRNTIRHRLAHVSINKEAIATLRARQLQLMHDITYEVDRLIAQHMGSRYFMIQLEPIVATELLGAMITHAGGRRPTRPQCARALYTIRTARAGTTYQVAKGISLRFTARNYQLTVV